MLTRAWISWDLTRDRLFPHPQVWPEVGSGARGVSSVCPTDFVHVATSGLPAWVGHHLQGQDLSYPAWFGGRF